MVLTRAWRTYRDGTTWVDWVVRKQGSRVVFFKINLCTRIADDTVEVCRYDTCHGRLHVHRFWIAAEDVVDLPLPLGQTGYRAEFFACAQDMATNGPRYVEAMRARRSRHD